MSQREKRGIPGSPNPLQHVGDVLPDLVGGLQPEEVEVAQQVVVRRQELQVQLGQRQAGLACTYFQIDVSGMPSPPAFRISWLNNSRLITLLFALNGMPLTADNSA